MKKIGLPIALLGVLIGIAACGGSDAKDQAQRVQSAVDSLPFHYRYRHVAPPDGADSVIAGRAISRDGAKLDFAITVGAAVGVPVPLTGLRGVQGSFAEPPVVLNENAGARLPGDSRHTFRERTAMAVDLADALCKEFTGKVCPI